ncbi:ribonuclease H-like domain-containing protein [Tanacetum coccineum]
MELENSQNNALAKLPMLKLGEYEMWEIRIKQYFQIQDYALWEVIENGNSWVPIPVTTPESGPSTALKMTVPSTTEEKICKKNDVKDRSHLLMALPNEHQLTFNQYADAQSMFVAIKARFRGNDATKKTQKALLKQQYENFNATSSESLDSIFNRLQKLVSRLAILGVDTSPEDLNVKRTVTANNDDKNLAFLTTSSPSSTNIINTVNTGVSTGNTKVNTASTETSTASFSDATVYAFLSTQPQGSQLVHEDLEQLHDDDLEEMDLKWNMALLSMRTRKFYQRTGRKIIIDGSSIVGYDKSKVECFNCHKMGHFTRECRAPRICKNPTVETNEPKSTRKENGAPIIKHWVSDSDEEDVPKVNTVKGTRVNTARPKAVLSAAKENKGNVVKASACWVWRPKHKVLDHGVIYQASQQDPYELLLGRKPALSFIRPFGCPVTILNTIDHLDKYDGKADEGFFVGYSTNSKAFRVFNIRTRIVEENLHVKFSETTPNTAGSRPNWLFDIDALTKSMNYKPVVTGNQSNGSAGTKACDNVGKARVETVPGKDYILLPLWTQDLLFSYSSKDSSDAGFKPSGEKEKKDTEELWKEGGNLNEKGERVYQYKDASVNSTNTINTVSSCVNITGIENNVVDENIVIGSVDDPTMPKLEEIGRFSDAEDDISEADMNNLDTYFQVSHVPTTRIHKHHPLKQVIRDLHSAPKTRRMTINLKEHGLFSSVQQRTNHKDFQNCLFACFLSQVEPKKVTQALQDPSWIEAMQDELL